MFDPVLITPDNRLLTWSTQDFSLYGDQTPVEYHVGRAHDARAAPSADPAETAEANRANSSGSAPASDLMDATVDGDTLASTPTSQSSASSQSPAVITDLAALQALSLTPAVLPSSGQTFDPRIAPSAPQPEAASETLAEGAPLAPKSLAEASEAVFGHTPILSLSAAVGETAGLLTTSVANLAHAVAPVVESVNDGLTSLAETATAPLLDTVDTLATATLDATSTGPLAAVAAPVEDALDGVLGVDPPGGIATLVSLVSISDVFDVGEDQSAESAAPILVPDLLDTLATDLPLDDALLGDVHHDEGPLGDLPHTDALGVI